MNRDCIQIIIPSKPEYVSTVRLATSSMASHVGFDVEAIEDLRVAISEACNMMMAGTDIKIEVKIDGNCMQITVEKVDQDIQYNTGEREEMGKLILSTLVDEVEFTGRRICFKKTVEEP
ncbi:MAG: ATP-binding protein [Tissierellia bacterium]|nr:ATP-binding protein [Tissierellia bacterium]